MLTYSRVLFLVPLTCNLMTYPKFLDRIFPDFKIEMLIFSLQICATRSYGVLTGLVDIIRSKKMFPTVFSTVLFYLLVATNMWATPPTQLSLTPAPESACQTHSSAARVALHVQLPGGSATGGAWLGAGAASSPPAPGPPIVRMRAPRVPSSPWRRRRRSAMPSVWTSPHPMEWHHVRTASLQTSLPPVSN